MLGKARIMGACMGGVQKVGQNGTELAGIVGWVRSGGEEVVVDKGGRG